MRLTDDNPSEPNAETAARWPALARLGLTVDDFRAHCRQGFVNPERRGRSVYWKLRFRRTDGRQVVRYVGADPAFVEQVRRELDALQRPHRAQRHLARLSRRARVLMRRIKQNLEPVLAPMGFAFHGQQIRRRRGPPPDATPRAARCG